MEKEVECVVLENGELEIPDSIICSTGTALRCINSNNAFLLITVANDNRFSGELLHFNGSVYRLPGKLMSELQINQGDKLKLVYSETLGFIIVVKA